MAIVEFNTADTDLSKLKLKILLYGPTGSGKTWFLYSMPDNYIISLDDGLLYAKLHGMNIQGATVDTLADANLLLDEIELGKRAVGCKSISVDGLDRLTDKLIDYSLQMSGKMYMDRNTWGLAADELRKFINRIKGLGQFYHIAVTTGDMLEKNELNGNIYGLPDTVGKQRKALGGYFDLFFYLVQDVVWKDGVAEKVFQMHTVQYIDFNAKDRTGVLNAHEPNDFPTIYQKFQDAIVNRQTSIVNGTTDVEIVQ